MTRIRPITISINALGGQGGGVLSQWIVSLAESQGYLAQATSVPGVAQRTGATIYCVELFPENIAEQAGKLPIFSLMPVPGDVDIVLASEWMEAGRAIARGFVTPDTTTLIASTHRDYAISEKSAMGDGIADENIVRNAAISAAKRLIAFDMARAARNSESVISAVMFGALAASNALPFPRTAFEAVINESGRAIESNLRAFQAGWEGAEQEAGPTDQTPVKWRRATTAQNGAQALLVELQRSFPHQVHEMVIEGARRLADYQDRRYAAYYVDLLKPVLKLDDIALGYRLTAEVARHLALWMSYEDVIRVADLKTRKTRFNRVRDEVRATANEIVATSEFLHPRVEELRDVLPLSAGRILDNSRSLQYLLNRFFHKGRHISTTSLRGFFFMRFIAALRPFRRYGFRHYHEMENMIAWLRKIKEVAEINYELALAITNAQRLIKGYGNTHANGLKNYNRILKFLDESGPDGETADQINKLVAAALADEDGHAFSAALSAVQRSRNPDFEQNRV